ncbi:hypothetical protein FQZ97_1037780 [compost metagenome]
MLRVDRYLELLRLAITPSSPSWHADTSTEAAEPSNAALNRTARAGERASKRSRIARRSTKKTSLRSWPST